MFNVDPQAVATAISHKPFALLPDGQNAIKNLMAGNCGMCGQPVGQMRNVASVTEFKIGGMCQKCQDSFYG